MLKKKINPKDIALANNWLQESDGSSLQKYVNNAINKYPDKVIEYKNGKKGLLGLFMGEIMRSSRGKADPKLVSRILREELEK